MIILKYAHLVVSPIYCNTEVEFWNRNFIKYEDSPLKIILLNFVGVSNAELIIYKSTNGQNAFHRPIF